MNYKEIYSNLEKECYKDDTSFDNVLNYNNIRKRSIFLDEIQEGVGGAVDAFIRFYNQEDDDKVYPEYHIHDTFKVHNKLAEVVSVLVDKDDDVYGYEVKFEDSDDTFIVYPEEIED